METNTNTMVVFISQNMQYRRMQEEIFSFCFNGFVFTFENKHIHKAHFHTQQALLSISLLTAFSPYFHSNKK